MLVFIIMLLLGISLIIYCVSVEYFVYKNDMSYYDVCFYQADELIDAKKNIKRLEEQLIDAEEHIESLELQLREQYELIDKYNKQIAKLKEQQDKISFAVEKLEKLKDDFFDISNGWWLCFKDGTQYMTHNELEGCVKEIIDNQIKQLKEGK